MSEQKTLLSIVCITHLTRTLSWTPIAEKSVPVYIEQWIQHTILGHSIWYREPARVWTFTIIQYKKVTYNAVLLTFQATNQYFSNRLRLQYGNLPSISSLNSFCLNSSAACFAFLGSSRSNFSQKTWPFPGPSPSSCSCAMALVTLRNVSGQAGGVDRNCMATLDLLRATI